MWASEVKRFGAPKRSQRCALLGFCYQDKGLNVKFSKFSFNISNYLKSILNNLNHPIITIFAGTGLQVGNNSIEGYEDFSENTVDLNDT